MPEYPIYKRQDNVFITAAPILTPSLKAHRCRHLHVVGVSHAFVYAVTTDWHLLISAGGACYKVVNRLSLSVACADGNRLVISSGAGH